MAKPTVTAIRWANVEGKELLYLKIEGGGESFTVNVGQKTYNKVKEMEAQMELPLKAPKDGNKG